MNQNSASPSTPVAHLEDAIGNTNEIRTVDLEGHNKQELINRNSGIPDTNIDSIPTLRPIEPRKRKITRTRCDNEACIPCSVKSNCMKCFWCLNKHKKQKCEARQCSILNPKVKKIKV